MSNTSMSEFINASAKLMLADRPYLWDSHEDAVEDITMAFADVMELDPDDPEEYSVHLSGFILTRTWLDEGTYEYTFSKKLVGLAIFTDDEESHVHDWTRGGNLASDVELNLPELDDEFDIEPNIIDDLNYEDEED